jgi:hypothetical protein
MSKQSWEECIAWATASGTTINTSTTETILFPNITVPGNYLADGRVIRLTAYGAYGTTATPTMTFSIRWGGVAGTVIAKSTAVTLTSAVGGGASKTALWSCSALIQVRSNGSTGTVFTCGEVTFFTNTAATAGTVTHYGLVAPIASGSTGGTTPVAVTIDATADTALSLTATWGTNNAANDIQGNIYVIEAMN